MNFTAATLADIRTQMVTVREQPDPERQVYVDRVSNLLDGMTRTNAQLKNKHLEREAAEERLHAEDFDEKVEAALHKIETVILNLDRSVALRMNSLAAVRADLARHDAAVDARTEQALRPLFEELLRRQHALMSDAAAIDDALRLGHEIANQQMRPNTSVLQRGFGQNFRERLAFWRERVSVILGTQA